MCLALQIIYTGCHRLFMRGFRSRPKTCRPPAQRSFSSHTINKTPVPGAQIIFCSCVNETTVLSPPYDRSCVKNGRSLRFPKILKKQIWWSNDKTVIELGYRKIALFASVSQIKMNRPFPSSPGPLYQLWHGNDFSFSCKITHCHKKGCAFGLI